MLQKILSENFEKIIKDQEKYNFNVDTDGVYLIFFSARCKNWLQNFKRLFNDDDLALKIDDYLFAEIKGKKREFSSAGSWNGNELKNKIKEVFVVLPLKKGAHAIEFWADGQPFLEKIEIYKTEVSVGEEINLAKSDFARFGGFKDVIFKNLTIGDLTIKARAEKNGRLELKVDGKTQLNSKYKKYAKWFWYGQELQGALKEYKAPYCLTGNFHSLEFRGQGQPKIESISFVIQDKSLKFKIGKVRLYEDIIISDLANLRSTPHLKSNQILAQLKNGDEVEILDERVVGEYIKDRSEIWHEVAYQDKKGFILSSLVEIEGQEREKIIDLIKEKCWQYNVDANIMLAIAGWESHYKPYASSKRECQGIFQLSDLTAIQMKVTDRYNLYQNIDGGVEYYKAIEEKFNRRGNVLERRLIAWHSGPSSISVDGPIDYSGLRHPDEARSFVKNVLKNIEKKDWFHIISLPLSVLIVISGLLTAYSFQSNQKYADVSYSLGQIVSPMLELENKNANASLYPEEITSFPAVFLDEEKDEVVFINSEEAEVGRIDVDLLNMDSIFETPLDFVGASGKNLTFIEPRYLEYPRNVFYFFVATSATCGANNCTFAFFRFNLDNKKLELVSKTLFGAIRKLYLSLDSQKVALFATSHGSATAENDHIHIFDLSNFKEWEIEDYFDWKFSAHYIDNFLWKNDNEIQFEVQYSKIPEPRAKRTIWLYNIDEGKSREVRSEIFDLNLSG